MHRRQPLYRRSRLRPYVAAVAFAVSMYLAPLGVFHLCFALGWYAS